MSKITNDGLTRSGRHRMLYSSVPIWQQWASKGCVQLFVCEFGCSELNADDQLLDEVRSMMGSLSDSISSRLEQLTKTKGCAVKYEDAFNSASAALTTARQQQRTDVTDRSQVISIAFVFDKPDVCSL